MSGSRRGIARLSLALLPFAACSSGSEPATSADPLDDRRLGRMNHRLQDRAARIERVDGTIVPLARHVQVGEHGVLYEIEGDATLQRLPIDRVRRIVLLAEKNTFRGALLGGGTGLLLGGLLDTTAAVIAPLSCVEDCEDDSGEKAIIGLGVGALLGAAFGALSSDPEVVVYDAGNDVDLLSASTSLVPPRASGDSD